jgi:polyhydroxyalkanoate synthase
MQAHHAFRRELLALADGVDAFAALSARARLHMHANLARAMRGRAPIPLVAGPATAHDVVADLPLARLLHYHAEGARRATPILIVASLINRYYVLDLLPGLSAIDLLRRRGFDVYVLDWKPPGAAGPDLGFADYLDGAIADGAEIAASAHGARGVLLLGYCMGGTLAAMFAARHPSQARAVALLGTPIDFHRSGVLAAWTDRRLFDADLVADVHGNMPAWLMQSGFKLLKPLDAALKMMRLHQEEDDEALLHLVALESWLEDNLAFPGGVYREYIRALYQDNALARGSMRIAGEPLHLRDLVAPLLDVVALRDHICEPASSRALMDLAGSTDKRCLEFDTGHIGLSASRRSHRELWPAIAGWLEERAG